MITIAYQQLSSDDYIKMSEAIIRARQDGQDDVADLIQDRMELDLQLIGIPTTQNYSKVNIDHLG